MNVQTILDSLHRVGPKKLSLLRHAGMEYTSHLKMKCVMMATDGMEMAAAVSVRFSLAGSALTTSGVLVSEILKNKIS